MKEIMTTAEVAELLGISVAAVHQLVARGTLGAGWHGSVRVFRRTVVEALKADPDYQARSRRTRFEASILSQGPLVGLESEYEAQVRLLDSTIQPESSGSREDGGK